MYAFRCSDAGEGEDLEEWSLPTLLTFELAWSPEMVRRGHEKSPHCKILSPPRQPVSRPFGPLVRLIDFSLSMILVRFTIKVIPRLRRRAER